MAVDQETRDAYDDSLGADNDLCAMCFSVDEEEAWPRDPNETTYRLLDA